MMKYKIIHIDKTHVATVKLAGRLDAATAQQLREAMLKPLQNGASTLIADMTAVTFIDSSGLSAFVSAFRATRERDGTLVLVAVPQQAQIALEQTGLIQLFQVFDSFDTADEALGLSS